MLTKTKLTVSTKSRKTKKTVSTAASKKIFSIAETADMLRVHPDTVSRWIKAGILKAVKVGGRVLIRLADIHAMLDANPAVCP
jgi:excisionase family DNA binding protein